MAGNACIWRSTSGAGTEASVATDKIEFDTGTVPDSTGHIRNTSCKIDISLAENSKVKGDINPLQDTGVARVIIIVTGHIQIKIPSSGVASGAYDLLKTWALEPKFNSTFPKGRFGLRMDDFPAFNLKPTSTRGYMLQDIEFGREGEPKNKLSFIATLRLNGDKGTAPYDWSV